MDRRPEIFFSYAHEDTDLMNDVRRQLIVFERNGRIRKWHDRMIPAGTEWRGQIDARLNAAQIVLLCMSPHFIESRYCYEVEGRAALQRHRDGETRVVPIILRPCAWEETPFGDLQALPVDAKPISRWSDRDEACLDVARGVMKVVDGLTHSPPLAHSPPPENLKLIYCSRCGKAAGRQDNCTGQYIHHEFIGGSSIDYCARCGVRPGTQTICTGQYIHHEFKSNASLSVICRRCGELAGKKTICTGQYIHHEFMVY